MSTPVLDAVREAFTRVTHTATHATAPLMGALGTPIVASRLIPEGQALMVGAPGTPHREVHVGIPSRNATEARVIVREGMADTLTWLGEPIQPWPLKVAARHYAQQDTP